MAARRFRAPEALSPLPAATQGEVWLADFGGTVGRKQAGMRPALIVSPARFNEGPLVLAAPLTRTERDSPLHVRVDPPAGGLRETGYIMCEQLRCVSRRRLREHWGSVDATIVRRVIARLRLLTPAPPA